MKLPLPQRLKTGWGVNTFAVDFHPKYRRNGDLLCKAIVTDKPNEVHTIRFPEHEYNDPAAMAEHAKTVVFMMLNTVYDKKETL